MTTYEEILELIERHQDTCFTCYNYRYKYCGFVFPDKCIPEDKFPADEEIQKMADDAYTLFLTQAYGDRCKRVKTEFDFLTEIENRLRNVPPGIDEDSVNYILQRAFRILNKYPSENPLYKNTPVKEETQKAINLMMAYIDFDSIQNGASIYRLIQAADLGYDRPSGLFKICPRQMAIGYMSHCVVQDHDGYYESDGSFDATIWDITRKQYIGPSWLDVMKYMQQAQPAIPEAIITNNRARVEPEPLPLDSHPELKQLVEAGILSNALQLKPKQSRRSLVQYCVEHELFKPWRLENWRSIDGILLDRSGALISAESLKQAFQDYQKLYM